MKLVNFSKNKKVKKMIIGSILGILIVVGSITLYKTFALYKEEQTFNVIRGQVPNFSVFDVQLSIVVDGEKSDFIPEKGNYSVLVTCDKGMGSWNYMKWSVEVHNFSNGAKCDVVFTTTEEEITNNEFERPTIVTLDAMSISSSSGVIVPTYHAKYIKIECSPSNSSIRVDGHNSNLGQYIFPAGTSNGSVYDILSKNANGIQLDVSAYSFIVIYYNVSSSSTTIKNVTVEWFYE